MSHVKYWDDERQVTDPEEIRASWPHRPELGSKCLCLDCTASRAARVDVIRFKGIRAQEAAQ